MHFRIFPSFQAGELRLFTDLYPNLKAGVSFSRFRRQKLGGKRTNDFGAEIANS